MLIETEPGRPNGRRKILRYSWVVVALVALYVGVVLFSRWRGNRELLARARAQAAAEQRAQDAQSIENMGGTRFEILGFYASPGVIRRGDRVSLCYAVANTQAVEIEPDIQRPLWPSPSRCLDISPTKTTTYILTAEDGQGHKKTASLTIEVR
ncbi:MAG TPA: hypothetical protein VEJ67_06170 [Candidatus Cybelea sp.]|nr:hypothetical protein [Candidatus Cybelea sp.]